MSCLGEMFMCLKSGQLHPVAHGTVSFLQEQFTDITGCFNVCSRSQLKKQTNKKKTLFFVLWLWDVRAQRCKGVPWGAQSQPQQLSLSQSPQLSTAAGNAEL